jgi:hypothetical protein
MRRRCGQGSRQAERAGHGDCHSKSLAPATRESYTSCALQTLRSRPQGETYADSQLHHRVAGGDGR